MTSAGKWVLGLLLLVVGAVFVARTVSSDPGDSSATVKEVLPSAQAAANAQAAAKNAAAAEAAAKKKIAATIAGDVSCKKACVEVNEVAADSITTAKLAPGSVTLSKLAFEVPNLNELENEINARKAAEASVKAAQAEAVAAGAKNDAAITVAASNGITQEAAARTAADEDLSKKTAAADADLLSKLNGEVKDRGDADNVLQGKLNTEIADRAGAINNMRSELGNGNQVAAPIVQINNNEIVGDAVTGNKILDTTISAADLGNDSIVGGAAGDVKDNTIADVDLADNAVVGRAVPGDLLTNVRARTLRGEREVNTLTGTTLSPGDVTLGTLTGEIAPSGGVAVGNLALNTIGTNNIANGQVTFEKLGVLVQDRIEDLEAGLAKEIVDRTADVDAEEAARIADVNAEESARITDVDAEEAARILDVNAEESARLAADALLQTGLNNEIAARTAADTTLTTNLAAELVNRAAGDTALQTALNTEVTSRLAYQAALLVNDANGAPNPNDADGLVHWNNLEGVPTSVLDADNKVTGLKNDLKNSDATAPNTGSNLVHWDNLNGVPLDFVDGVVTFSNLSGVPTSMTAAFADNVLEFNDLSNSIGATQIANGTVTFAMLASPVQTRITTAEADIVALKGRIDALKVVPGVADTDRVATQRLTALNINDPSVAETSYSPVSVPAGTSGQVTLTVTGVRSTDLTTVTPPSSLPAGVFMVGSSVTAPDTVVVRIYNSTTSAFDSALVVAGWQVRWIDLTP